MLYGIHNYFVADLCQAYGGYTVFFTCTGVIFAYLVRMVNLSQEGVDKKRPPFNAIVINAIGGFLADILVAITFKFAIADGINSGVITSIFSLSCLNTCFLFWYLYD